MYLGIRQLNLTRFRIVSIYQKKCFENHKFTVNSRLQLNHGKSFDLQIHIKENCQKKDDLNFLLIQLATFHCFSGTINHERGKKKSEKFRFVDRKSKLVKRRMISTFCLFNLPFFPCFSCFINQEKGKNSQKVWSQCRFLGNVQEI